MTDEAMPDETKADETKADEMKVDGAPREGAAPDSIAPADDGPAALETEIAALRDQLLRALAEAENQRRRASRERDDAVKYAAAQLARDLLTVPDNLRRALDAVPADAVEKDEFLGALKTGVELVERELLAAFERHAIAKIVPRGERFDPNLHQAMFEVPTDEHPAGTVVQVVQPGYMMGERLLRPALVGVARPSQPGPAKPPGASMNEVA